MTHTTIAAISTPLGPGGIGIIRISGPDAYTIIRRLFVRHTPSALNHESHPLEQQLVTHVMYYGHIIEPFNKHTIDEVLTVYMQGPKSFTREDVVEIHSHSGYVVLDRILSAVLDAGAALAAPGEFTQRAFLNGRIDLTQAEAVIDLINAPCETAVQMASGQIAGGLRHTIKAMVGRLTALRANCEASIEFAEVDHEDVLREVKNILKNDILPEISALIQRQKETALFRDGVLLTIAGAPNVGKSSLLNKLVERETAIVSDIPGTTRDVVQDYFSINGLPVSICDTAGIHDTCDPIECIGMEKARDHCRRADLVLLVLEATRRINDFEKKMVDELKHTKTIAVINKDDLADDDAILKIRKRLNGVPNTRVSAKFSSGIALLKEMIFKALMAKDGVAHSEQATPNLRQRKILEKASQSVKECILAGDSHQPLEIVSEMLSNCLFHLEDISGKTDQEGLYDYIFSQFCVGK